VPGTLPRAPRVHLTTLGCAKNLVDSERLLGRLGAAGAVVGAPPEEADVIIVNTCGFIQPAKEESLAAIADLARHRRRGPCRALLVIGCLAQRYADDLQRRLPDVDGVFGLGREEAVVRACGLAPGERGRLLLTPRHTAYLRISEGCDNRCSYCAIPLIRGPFRSRPVEDVLEEARTLLAAGVRELILIGQDTTLYGADRPGAPRIHQLLARLSGLPRLRWLRLLYTHPAHFTDDLVEAYASLPRLCPYVDLPLQHLNDRLLRRMGRQVTQRRVLALLERLRERIPGVTIRTTFLVGFPGETRREFNELLHLVRRLRFDHLGAFAYSREEGTPAARMRGQVSDRAKARRLRDLMLAQQEIVFERHRAAKGRIVEAVVDGPAADAPGVWIARSRAQAPDVDSAIRLRGRGLRPGRFLKVRITGAEGYDLLARPVQSSRHSSPGPEI